MKLKKLMSCHNFSRAVNPNIEWDFGDQRSYRTVNRFPKRPNSQFYSMINYDKKSDYGRHSFYPGQRVWIIRIDNRTGRYSTDWDHIVEVFGYSDVGRGGLFDYWLNSYGIGHGIQSGDLYLTKAAAQHNIRGVVPWKEPVIIGEEIDN